MYRWICIDAVKDTWAYVDDHHPGAYLVVVRKNDLDGDWWYTVIREPSLTGHDIARTTAMRRGVQAYENLVGVV
jgi:hypothetical protein